MTSQDESRFYQSLNLLGAFFTDELNDIRQRLYWQVMHAKCSIEEFQGACLAAMERETVYKVPLPSTMLDYVREYRAAQRDAKQSTTTEGQLLALREELVSPEDIRRLIASVWPDTQPEGEERDPLAPKTQKAYDTRETR